LSSPHAIRHPLITGGLFFPLDFLLRSRFGDVRAVLLSTCVSCTPKFRPRARSASASDLLPFSFSTCCELLPSPLSVSWLFLFLPLTFTSAFLYVGGSRIRFYPPLKVFSKLFCLLSWLGNGYFLSGILPFLCVDPSPGLLYLTCWNLFLSALTRSISDSTGTSFHELNTGFFFLLVEIRPT